MNFPILSTLIFLPLVSSFFILLSKDKTTNVSSISISLFSSVATFFLSLFLWYSLDISISEFQFVEEKSWINNFIKFKIPPELKNEIKNDQFKINFFSNEINFFYDFQVKDFWSTEKTYLYFISIALLAGFILNFMPCVLPVLSLKIANFISTKNSDGFKLKRKIFNQILGIITSFFILFITIIATSIKTEPSKVKRKNLKAE